MPNLRTDDGPRKLRAVWLGPKGATLPFEWTYVQWVVTLAAMPATAGLLWLLGTAVHQLIPVFDTFLVGAVAFIWGPALGVYLTVKVMRHVSFDQPLAARTRLVHSELRRPRLSIRPTELEVSPPPVTDLALPAARSLGWHHPHPSTSVRPAAGVQRRRMVVIELRGAHS